MNCSDCEQLFDAYLDGHLAGSLRLEFDAHRLRCRRCQQTLAMMETIGHVIASDPHAPELSPSFTQRVMQDIGRSRTVRFPLRRVALVAAAFTQAAAVLLLAIFWNSRPVAPPAEPGPPTMAAVTDAWPGEGDPAYNAVLGLIVEGVEDRIWEMYRGGARMTADVKNLAQYLNITTPEDIARESSKIAGVNPWQAFWGTLGPEDEPRPAPSASADEVHSI